MANLESQMTSALEVEGKNELLQSNFWIIDKAKSDKRRTKTKLGEPRIKCK